MGWVRTLQSRWRTRRLALGHARSSVNAEPLLRVRAAETELWSQAPVGGQPENAVGALIAEVEQTALAVYAHHGLPVRRGHYSRSPGSVRWKFISATMTPEQRWAIALTKPTGAGWRFATLAEIGRMIDNDDVRTAADILIDCEALKIKVRDRNIVTFPADIACALSLGARWRTLEQLLARRERGRLQLLPPRERSVRKPRVLAPAPPDHRASKP